MMLYKFCKQEHNIAIGCNTLRLGTLQEYREMDSSFYIADQWEGISQAGTNGKPVTFTGKELSSAGVSLPAMSLGPNDSVNLTGKGNLIMKIPNVYIFSVSSKESNDSLKDYDSRYTIYNPQSFASELVRLFINQLSFKDFDFNFEYGNYLVSEMNQINIQCIHQPVKYKEKPFIYNEENKIEVLKIINNPVESYFTKSVEKNEDEEYRFVILPTINRQIISVKKEAKILNIRAFNGIINV
ncbi:MAG: hypothetical protein KF900_03100 [Bacteroidetes bacterium]|nr:hypothetical protein [Bacteroidota bacterium]